jgi:hypothetical protein
MKGGCDQTRERFRYCQKCLPVPLIDLLLLDETSGLTSKVAAPARLFELRLLGPSKADNISLAVGLRSLAEIPFNPELLLLSIAAEGRLRDDRDVEGAFPADFDAASCLAFFASF